MNETIRRFGHPATLIADYGHWVVLLRPAQPTLGSLVMAAKGDATAYSGLPATAFVEQARVIADVEAALAAAVGYAKINYLMLMMVDPHVHFHIIPRYEGARTWQGVAFADAGWPKLPALGEAIALDETQVAAMRDWLKSYWR